VEEKGKEKDQSTVHHKDFDLRVEEGMCSNIEEI